MGDVLFIVVCIMLAVILVIGLMYSSCKVASWADEQASKLKDKEDSL